jgi:hypothetical protein
MRRSELDPRVSELVGPVLGACRSPLVVGAELSIAGASLTQLDALPALLSQAHESRHDGALWLIDARVRRLDGELVESVRALRSVLAAGAPLVLVCATRRGLQHTLRLLLGSKKQADLALVDLCDALLRNGLSEPRAHGELPRWLIASARVPERLEALDELFTQPPSLSGR